MLVLAGQTELMEIIGAADASGSVTNLLDSRKQQTDQDADDGNDYEQFDKCESLSLAHGGCLLGGWDSVRSEFRPTF